MNEAQTKLLADVKKLTDDAKETNHSVLVLVIGDGDKPDESQALAAVGGKPSVIADGLANVMRNNTDWRRTIEQACALVKLGALLHDLRGTENEKSAE